MSDEGDGPEVERVARELARWHGSAYAFHDRERQMQTVASAFSGHRFAHASDQYADAKWKQYRGAAKHALEMVAAEREACAKIAEDRAATGEYGTWQAQEGLIIAAEIRARNTSQG